MAPRVLCTETDEVARNGALQRKNFGQRFSWAPLAFFRKIFPPPPNTALPIPQTERPVWFLIQDSSLPGPGRLPELTTHGLEALTHILMALIAA